MAVNCSPFGPSPQFELASGLPNVGGLLFFYAAGSTTKQNTFTDSTGLVANTNPIVLNALGMPTNTQIWFTEGQLYKVVYAPANDTDPPTSPIKTWDNLTGITAATTTLDQWVSSQLTPTYVSATQFTLIGDQTAAFEVNRRLRTTLAGGTGYHTITATAFSLGLTTVTVNGTALDAGLSAVSLGLLSATNNAIPWAAVTFSGLTVLGGFVMENASSSTIGSMGSAHSGEVKILLRAATDFGSNNTITDKWSLRIGGTTAGQYIKWFDEVAGVERARVTPKGMEIGGMVSRSTTNPSNAINIYNGTAPVGTLANGVTLYATGGKLFAMDAAGVATQLTP